MTFPDLGLCAPVLRALDREGYTTPTPIQQQAIPLVLEGHDVLGMAQTGTGKTGAFAIPILHQLCTRLPRSNERAPKVLVLSPTRELAQQILDSFKAYGYFLPLRCAVVVGGVSQRNQEKALRQGVDVLIATPGRLMDLMGQGLVQLKLIDTLVLDEADRMLDMGFLPAIQRIAAALPTQRQTLMFSATMPKAIETLAQKLLHNPQRVSVAPASSVSGNVEQEVYRVTPSNKRKLLAELLENPEVKGALVFTRTKHGADKLTETLVREGFKAKAIHGNKSQGARQQALNDLKSHRIQVLVATDVAARGIDVDHLSLVVNYDLPMEAETYVHRIGRTGRAGAQGKAVSFCTSDEGALLAGIQKLLQNPIPVVQHPTLSDSEPLNIEASSPNRGGGNRSARNTPRNWDGHARRRGFRR